MSKVKITFLLSFVFMRLLPVAELCREYRWTRLSQGSRGQRLQIEKSNIKIPVCEELVVTVQ